MTNNNSSVVIGRFAPTPSARMHLGNLACALVAWLSTRSKAGKFILRIEDLDQSRCKNLIWIDKIKEDLDWLGLHYDNNCAPSEYQSNRSFIYQKYLSFLMEKNIVYPCFCSRDELRCASAPHLSDRTPIYSGNCRKYLNPALQHPKKDPSFRIQVPDETIMLIDGIQGIYSQNLAIECGDFILRRSDGIFSYQLAVVVDDALNDVTEVVRGYDLLSSTPRQIWLYRLFHFPSVNYYHIPLFMSHDGTRLSKRADSLNVDLLKYYFHSPQKIIGLLAYLLGLLKKPEAIDPENLIPLFDFQKIHKTKFISLPKNLLSLL